MTEPQRAARRQLLETQLAQAIASGDRRKIQNAHSTIAGWTEFWAESDAEGRTPHVAHAGRGGSKTFAEMSNMERHTLYVSDRATFDRLYQEHQSRKR